jgi:hypothetical protein
MLGRSDDSLPREMRPSRSPPGPAARTPSNSDPRAEFVAKCHRIASGSVHNSAGVCRAAAFNAERSMSTFVPNSVAVRSASSLSACISSRFILPSVVINAKWEVTTAAAAEAATAMATI